MIKIPVMIPFIGEEEEKAVCDVLKTGWVAQGPKVLEFEKSVANHEGVKYGIATTSCTTALHLALIALGVKEGEDVIVPSFTFVATANAVEYTGATPILVDISSKTYTIDVDKLDNLIEERYIRKNGEMINKKTSNKLVLIIAVNLFGLCADILKINALAKKYNLKVLEDSACAFGAKINNICEGSFGNISCLSFHPRKSITTGEGGMVLVNDDVMAEKIYQIRSHGASVSEINRHKNKGYLLPEFNQLGYNYRMTDIQAAVGVEQMKKADFILEERNKKADTYRKLLEKVDFMDAPFLPDGYYHTYQSFVCMINYKNLGLSTIEEGNSFRNLLMEKLDEMGIATRVGTHAVHMLGYYQEKYGYNKRELMGAYETDMLSITLPLYIQMTDENQNYVIDKIVEIKNKILEEIK